MNKILLFLSVFLLSCGAFAQSSDRMSYQAVIRNSAGVLVVNNPVGMRIRILHKTDIGNAVYVETHSGTTNANGLLTIKIGSGTVASGNYNTIDWSDGPYFLQTEIDPSGGTNYSTITNVSQMLSVPFAMYAKTSGSTASDGTNWTINGNSATASSYIGTQNDHPLNFKINNSISGSIGKRHTSIGFNSLLVANDGSNSAFGSEALRNNANGSANTAIGDAVLKNNTSGSFNTAIGREALFSNTTGMGNTANGVTALYSNTTGEYNSANSNMALFHNTTGSKNTALGAMALNSNTTGNENIAIGYMALFSHKYQDRTIAIGDSALFYNNAGRFNTAIGSKTLLANMGGEENTAVGYEALKNNAGTSINAGSSNTAIGYHAMTANLTGRLNTATGVSSLKANTTGHENTAAGFASLHANTTGTGNTAFGRTALGTNTIGNYNTAIGFLANVSSNNLTNATVIGYNAKVAFSNSVHIGNMDVTAVRFGNVSTTRIYAHSLVTPSDSRFKYNIQNNVPGLDFIRELQPVTYYFDSEKLDEYTKTGKINNSNIRPVSYKGQNALHTGFLAQDVEKLANKLGYSFDGVHAPDGDKDHYSLSYSKFIMPMVKAIQEQQEMIEQQNTITLLQQKTIEKLQQTIEKLEQKLEALSTK